METWMRLTDLCREDRTGMPPRESATADDVRAYLRAYYGAEGVEASVAVDPAPSHGVFRATARVGRAVDHWDVWVEGGALYGEC